MPIHPSVNSFVNSLFFYIQKKYDLPKEGLRSSVRCVVTKSLNDQNPSVVTKIDYSLYKTLCKGLSDLLGINFCPSFFAFPWPKDTFIKEQEIQKAWEYTMQDSEFGNFFNADIIGLRSPILTRKGTKWILSPFSPVPDWVFRGPFKLDSEQIEINPSHTDIERKILDRAENDDVKAMYILVGLPQLVWVRFQIQPS